MEKKVLLVDDDAKLRKLLREYLEGYQFHVLTLADGAAVSSRIQQEFPDIVILDIMLPKKDGLEVLKEIRTDSNIPVIMLTARGEEADRVIGLELGADDYLPKPLSATVLKNAVARVLRCKG